MEPIIRHGNAVRIEEYANVRSLISASVDMIKGWQSEGYETIAVVLSLIHILEAFVKSFQKKTEIFTKK